jgi:hypothetical protein
VSDDRRNEVPKATAPSPSVNVTRWGLPALAIIAVAAAYAVRASSAGGAHSAVLLVGSRTGAAFLDCQAQVRSDVTGDPAVVVVSGGELAGFEVLKDSDVHAPREGGEVDIVGLSIGPPSLGRLASKASIAPDRWLAAPIYDSYPLGLVVTQDVLSSIEPQLRPCGGLPPGRSHVERCLRPGSVRALLRAEHEARAHGAATRFLMVPDSAGGTWEALDRLIWPKGEEATSEWIEPDARFRIAIGDVTQRPRTIAFGLPPTGPGACEPPFGVREIGVCDVDGDDGAPCNVARVGLFAYTRIPAECAGGKPCRLHEPVCAVLRSIYGRLADERGRAWSSTCEVANPASEGLIRPF